MSVARLDRFTVPLVCGALISMASAGAPRAAQALDCTQYNGDHAHYEDFCAKCGGTYDHNSDGQPICRNIGGASGAAGASVPGFKIIRGVDAADTIRLSAANYAAMNAASIGAGIGGILRRNAARAKAKKEEAERQAEWERQEEARIAREMEAKWGAKKLELSGKLKGGSDGRLTFKDPGLGDGPCRESTSNFGKPGSAACGDVLSDSQHLGLSLKTVDEKSSPATSAMAQLSRAVFLSIRADKADNEDDQRYLNDAAFRAAMGQPINFLPNVEEVVGIPVGRQAVEDFEPIKQEYLESKAGAETARARLDEVKVERQVARQLRAEAETRVKELLAAAPKPQASPKPGEPAVKKEKKEEPENDKLAEARKLLAEAVEMDEKMSQKEIQADLNSKQADQAEAGREKEARKKVVQLGRATSAGGEKP